MPTLASLTLNGHSYDVKVQNHNFDVPIGWSGFPRQSLLGDGQLHILMDTPADNFILELMFKTKENPVAEGCLEVYDGTSDIPIRRIQFSKAYITRYRETFDLLGNGRMTTYVQISPMQMTINKKVKMERRFFWLWSEVEEEPIPLNQSQTVQEDKEIVDIYWTYGKDEIRIKEISRFYVDMNLHIKTRGYAAGEYLSITIRREDGLPVSLTRTSISFTGKVDENGEIILLNILKDYTLNLD